MSPHWTPMEISLGGIYFPPALFAGLFGLTAAWLIIRLLHVFNLANKIWYPGLFFVALVVICTGLVGTFIIPMY